MFNANKLTMLLDAAVQAGLDSRVIVNSVNQHWNATQNQIYMVAFGGTHGWAIPMSNPKLHAGLGVSVNIAEDRITSCITFEGKPHDMVIGAHHSMVAFQVRGFNAKGIPTLVIVSPDGRKATRDAVKQISKLRPIKDPKATETRWDVITNVKHVAIS